MAAITIRKPDIYVRFSNGLLGWNMLQKKKFMTLFIYKIVWASGPFEKWTGNRMVKDHLKTDKNVLVIGMCPVIEWSLYL
jgi:hypothetical protein